MKKAATKTISKKKKAATAKRVATPKKKTVKKAVATKKKATKKTVRKAASKKTVTKKTTAKKTAAKKITAKATAKKATGKKASTRKAPAVAKKASTKPKKAAKTAAAKRARAEENLGSTLAPRQSGLVEEGSRLHVGDEAPSFVLSGTNRHGETYDYDLSQYLGRNPVVLYFYPKDDTPGCTREACDFRDNWARIEGHGAVVFGVSADDAGSHQRFADKFSLPFTLLTDADHQVAEAYGAWGEKNMYGRTYMGILRATYLIDRDGRIAAIWPKVSVDGHADEVIAAIERLG